MGAFKEISIMIDETCEACGAQFDMPEKCYECEISLMFNGKNIVVEGKSGKIVEIDGKEI